MAASLQKVLHSHPGGPGRYGAGSSSSSSCKGAATSEKVVPEQFPVGLRVLVVDDDVITLKVLEKMSIRCHYHVTTCSEATAALNLLRERKGCFDVVLSDVHMPDMDGFKLLELVGLEMDLPVIMMSADGRTSAVMKGIRHGACDYLIKPVREEELRNIWQHVARKILNGNKEHENSGSLEDNDRSKRGNDDDAEYTSVADASEVVVKARKKRSYSKEEDDAEMENDDSSTSKKPRVVWSEDLHQQFLSAVNQLGLDKAVPKRILELMNVPGLTRENVASHLQKFRLYLKRLTVVAQQQNGMPSTESQLGAPGRFNIQDLAAAGHVPPDTLAALHAELLGHPATNTMPRVDRSPLPQASTQRPKHSHSVAYGQPLVKCPSNIAKSFHQSTLTVDGTLSGYGAWPPSNSIGLMGPGSGLGRVGVQNNNMLMDISHRQQRQQHQQKQQPQQQQSPIQDQSCSFNVQPSRMVVPSQSSTFHAVNSPASVNENHSFGRDAFIDYSSISQEPNNSLSNSQAIGVLCGYPTPSIPSKIPSCAVGSSNSNIQQLQNPSSTFGAVRPLPSLLPMSDRQVPGGTKSGDSLDQACLRNLGFVCEDTGIPSRFAANDIESSIGDFSQIDDFIDSNGDTLKEPNFMNGPNERHPVLQRCPSSDHTNVFTG